VGRKGELVPLHPCSSAPLLSCGYFLYGTNVVDDIGLMDRAEAVTLLIEAEDGTGDAGVVLEALVQPRRQRLRVGGLVLLDGILNNAERVRGHHGPDALRILSVLGLVVGEELLGLRIIQVAGQRFRRGDETLGVLDTGDFDQIGVVRGVAAQPLRGHPERRCLLQQQAALSVVAGVVDRIGVDGLDVGQRWAEVIVLRVDGVVEHRGDTQLPKILFRRLSQPLRVGGVVMQDGDVLVAHILDHEIRCEEPLSVVQEANAEELWIALGRQAGRRGGWRDVENSGVAVNLGSWLGGAGVVAADHGHDLLRDQAVGDQGGLFRVAFIVFDDELDLLAVDATGRIGLIDQQLDGVLEPLAFLGVVAGQWSLKTDLNGVATTGRSAGRQRGGEDDHQQN
jgi:hypothetical protein